MTDRFRTRGSVTTALCVVLGIALVLIAIVVVGAMLGWNRVSQEVDDLSQPGMLDSLFEQENRPEIEAAVAKKEALIASIDSIVLAESTKFQVAAKLEQLALPDDVIYLALSREVKNKFNDEITEIARRIEWSGHSISVINGTGSGTLHTETGDVPVIVVTRDVADRDFADEWVMYLRDSGPVASTSGVTQ